MTMNPNLPPPKKPVNAYFHFQRDKTLEFRQANPGKPWIEISKLLGQTYKQLPITEKKKYADLAAADKERYEKENQEYMEYMEKCTIHAKKRRKSLPTDDEDEEYIEDPPKKRKGDKVNDINLHVRRNPKNQVCFVEIDELTGKETLVPYVCLLNEMISSMPESEVTPELQCQIEELMQEDKEDIENGKIREKEMYEDLGAADKERYKKEFGEFTEECKIHATKSTNSLPVGNDDDKEYKENPPKKMEGDKAKDTLKETSHIENNVIFEDAAGSRPGPNPNKPHVRRNSLNQICFVQIDILTGKEILVPGVYLLNEMLNRIPESELTPEVCQKIEAARQKDKENLENAKREVGEKVNP